MAADRESLPLGKLPPDLLAELLGVLPSDASVVVGPSPGIDAAVIASGDMAWVLAMDPVTLSSDPGRLAVQINANDIAVMGAQPRWLLIAILLPEGANASDARAIMKALMEESQRLGATLIGGHTEVTASVTQPVVVGCMLGQVDRDRLVTSAGARPGDALLALGPVGLEGTAILARDEAQALRERGLEEAVIEEAAGLLDSPGVGILDTVEALLSVALPHAMHDPTEGGVATALREMAVASRVGLRIDVDSIPIPSTCREICNTLGLDPLGLLASGSVLASVESQETQQICDALAAKDIACAVIGRVVAADQGITMVRDGKQEPLVTFERDELARWLEHGSRKRL